MKPLLALLLAGVAICAWADPVDVQITLKNGKTITHHANTKHAKNSGPAADVEGTLLVIHADYPGKSEYTYQVQSSSSSLTTLNVDQLPVEGMIGHRQNARVKVHGRGRAGQEIDPESVTVTADPLSELAPPLGVTSMTSLYIIVQFSDQVSPPVTQAQIQPTAQQAVNFYAENSFNQVAVTPTVTPPLKLAIATPTTCDYNGIGSAANTAANAAGYNTNNYTFLLYYFGGSTPCGWLGLAYVGSPKWAWVRSNSQQVFTHEQGHNFGLLHCGSVGKVGTGQPVTEYGDPYCTMGNQHGMHYNVAQKNILGWITSGQIATYPGSGTKTYTIQPREIGGASTYAVKIPTPNTNRTYWVELVTPVGFDISGPAVFVHLSNPFESSSGSDDTQILNVGANYALPLNTTYADPTYPAITITPVSIGPTSAVVQVGGGTATLPLPTGLRLSP